MDNFDYSDEALSIKALFYKKERSLYVEGEDDIIFWEILLSKFQIENFHVEDVGGKNEIKKYVDKIHSGADFFVAMDSDYDYLYSFIDHPKILRTCDHSIENSIINIKSTINIIKNKSRLSSKNLPAESEVNLELNKNLKNLKKLKKLKKLIFLDIYNDHYNLGEKVIPENFGKIFSAYGLNTDGLNHQIKILNISVKTIEAKDILNKLKISNKKIYSFLRGHIHLHLFQVLANYFIKKNKENNIIKIHDDFFSTAISEFEKIFSPIHEHYDHYRVECLKLSQLE